MPLQQKHDYGLGTQSNIVIPPWTHCTAAAAGSLGRGRDPVPGECKAVTVIYTLELAVLGSANLQSACKFKWSAWPWLLDRLPLLRRQPSAHSSVQLFAIFIYTATICYINLHMRQCKNMQLCLRASLERDTGALWGQPCRNGGAAVWVTSLWRYICKGKGLLYWHQMPLPASALNYGRKCLAFQLGQK